MSDELFQAGTYKQQYQYKSFSPNPINRSFKWDDPQIAVLLEEATRMLGELNAYSRLVPDIDFFIRAHIFQEAVTSSRIEGTKTNIEEALLPEEEISPERKDDVAEVKKYVAAMNFAITTLKKLPLSMRLICQTHEILLKDVRGKHKNPGEIRRSQNWIGGATLKDAIFIPPHHDELPDLLSDLEKFQHNESLYIPHLIRIALTHYQFETIHPFLDGNGRIGRLFITLYLVEKHLLEKPTLYLSDFFERNKANYYDALTAVRTSNNIEHWLKFFLVGVAQTAQKSKTTLEKIVALRLRCEQKLLVAGKRAKSAQQLLNHLFTYPYVSVNLAMNHLSASHQTANALIKIFVEQRILKEVTGKKRNRLFVFDEYLKMFNSND